MKQFDDMESFKDYVLSNTYIKISFYIGAGILCIWMLGKASLVVAGATKNVKMLIHELN